MNIAYIEFPWTFLPPLDGCLLLTADCIVMNVIFVLFSVFRWIRKSIISAIECLSPSFYFSLAIIYELWLLLVFTVQINCHLCVQGFIRILWTSSSSSSSIQYYFQVVSLRIKKFQSSLAAIARDCHAKIYFYYLKTWNRKSILTRSYVRWIHMAFQLSINRHRGIRLQVVDDVKTTTEMNRIKYERIH